MFGIKQGCANLCTLSSCWGINLVLLIGKSVLQSSLENNDFVQVVSISYLESTGSLASSWSPGETSETNQPLAIEPEDSCCKIEVVLKILTIWKTKPTL